MSGFLQFRRSSRQMEDTNATKSLTAWREQLNNEKAKHARLKRCQKLEDVYLCQAFYDLLKSLYPTYEQQQKLSHREREQLALVAFLCAHIKKPVENELKLGKKMGQGRDPLIKEVRFRKWLTQTDPNDFFIATLRIIRQLDNTPLCLSDVADIAYHWTTPIGTNTRKQLAYDYFTASDLNSDDNYRDELKEN
jgi:CRISPR type I-E-associated protein CasB/Cse2